MLWVCGEVEGTTCFHLAKLVLDLAKFSTNTFHLIHHFRSPRYRRIHDRRTSSHHGVESVSGGCRTARLLTIHHVYHIDISQCRSSDDHLPGR
jgi:hypothetical protein